MRETLLSLPPQQAHELAYFMTKCAVTLSLSLATKKTGLGKSSSSLALSLGRWVHRLILNRKRVGFRKSRQKTCHASPEKDSCATNNKNYRVNTKGIYRVDTSHTRHSFSIIQWLHPAQHPVPQDSLLQLRTSG